MAAMRRAVLVLLAFTAAARAPAPSEFATPPADVLCAARAGGCLPQPAVLVISAFPAEIEPLITAAHITETVAWDGRTYYLGTLEGVRVVLVRGGIMLVNAEATVRAALERFS